MRERQLSHDGQFDRTTELLELLQVVPAARGYGAATCIIRADPDALTARLNAELFEASDWMRAYQSQAPQRVVPGDACSWLARARR